MIRITEIEVVDGAAEPQSSSTDALSTEMLSSGTTETHIFENPSTCDVMPMDLTTVSTSRGVSPTSLVDTISTRLSNLLQANPGLPGLIPIDLSLHPDETFPSTKPIKTQDASDLGSDSAQDNELPVSNESVPITGKLNVF